VNAHPESKYREPAHQNGEDCKRPCGEHALVGGAYPNEFKYSCQWCGDDGSGQCRYCYYSEMPSNHEAPCGTCGRCDCDVDGPESAMAYLCQIVGECSGLAYDVVFNAIKGNVLCLNCFENLRS